MNSPKSEGNGTNLLPQTTPFIPLKYFFPSALVRLRLSFSHFLVLDQKEICYEIAVSICLRNSAKGPFEKFVLESILLTMYTYLDIIIIYKWKYFIVQMPKQFSISEMKGAFISQPWSVKKTLLCQYRKFIGEIRCYRYMRASQYSAKSSSSQRPRSCASCTENGSCFWACLTPRWHGALCWCGEALSLVPQRPVIKKDADRRMRRVGIRLSLCFPLKPYHLCPLVPQPPLARCGGQFFIYFEFEMPVELVQSTVTLFGGPCICV